MLNLDRITALLLTAVNIHLPACKYLSRIPLPHETHTILSPSHLNTQFNPRFQPQRTLSIWLSSASAPHPKVPQTREPSPQPKSSHNQPRQRSPSPYPTIQLPPNKFALSSCNSWPQSVAFPRPKRAVSRTSGRPAAAKTCAPTVSRGTPTSSGARTAASFSKRSRLSCTSRS